MSDNGKVLSAALTKVDRNQRYPLEDSLRLVKETARAKFDETVELAIRWVWIHVRPIKMSAAR